MSRNGAKSVLSLLISILCSLSPSDVECQTQQQQYFRIKPQANVEVIQGSTIVLYCAVSSQTGAAQWSKNGFLLGMYPRAFDTSAASAASSWP